MKRLVVDIEQVQEYFCDGVGNDRSEWECNDECQPTIDQGADQIHSNNAGGPAANGFEDSDLIGLLRDEVGDGVEDQDRADHHTDQSQQLLYLRHRVQERSTPVLIRIFILKPGNIDILFCQLVLNGSGHLFRMLFTVGRHTHIEPTELALRNSQALHALAIHEEECQIHKLRRRHKGMADETR